MGALCARHAHFLDPAFGSCATLHGDWRTPEQTAHQRDRARRMSAALTTYADYMQAASRALSTEHDHVPDERAARALVAEANASLHMFPDLRRMFD